MFRDNKIIIVDNEEKELNALASIIWKEGIACKAFRYDEFYDPPLKGVRVAFFDVNLTSSIAPHLEIYDYKKNSTIRDIFYQLATALQLYIAKDNGPYALIFWTNNQSLINNFKVYMDDRGSDYSIPHPIYIGCIDKINFLSQNSSEDGLLYKSICKSIQDSPINLLFDLENKANQAITNTINDIYSITLDDNCSWQQQNNNLKQTFIEIAKSTVGSEHVNERLSEGIIAGLNPMINFHMEQLTISHENMNDLLQVSKGGLNSNSFNPEKKYELNTIFHINKNVTKCERGAVYACNPDLKEIYIGKEEYDNWVKQLVNFKKTPKEKDAIKMNDIISNSQLIAVEVSPACDYSQKKDRLLKFILGIKTKEIEKSLLSNTIPAYSFFQKTLFKQKNNEIFQLIFNFNYTISLPRSNKPIGELLFTLKKEYMDLLTTRYANHISRIGITEFK